jgi:uncharacterized lipoprotein YajG
MKKYLLLFGAIMILALAGCSKTDNTVPSDNQSASTEQVDSTNSLSVTCSPMIKKTLDKLIADNAKLDKKARKVEK